MVNRAMSWKPTRLPSGRSSKQSATVKINGLLHTKGEVEVCICLCLLYVLAVLCIPVIENKSERLTIRQRVHRWSALATDLSVTAVPASQGQVL